MTHCSMMHQTHERFEPTYSESFDSAPKTFSMHTNYATLIAVSSLVALSGIIIVLLGTIIIL